MLNILHHQVVNKSMKKKLSFFFAAIFALFMALTNFSFLRYYLPQTYPHPYCADKCKFWTIEKATGRNPLASVENSFNTYKVETNQPNLVLHRRFYRKWWQIWNWADFLTHERWSYPYAEKDEDT